MVEFVFEDLHIGSWHWIGPLVLRHCAFLEIQMNLLMRIMSEFAFEQFLELGEDLEEIFSLFGGQMFATGGNVLYYSYLVVIIGFDVRREGVVIIIFLEE
jgi:hypothetical protein